LNDCWPVASWASVDYLGRWKALQYYSRCFYDDVLVSPHAHDGKIEVYVVSDKMQPLSGRIQARLLDFSGNVLFEKEQAAQIPPASSAVYLTLDEKDLFADSSETDHRHDFWLAISKLAGRPFHTTQFILMSLIISRFLSVRKSTALSLRPRTVTRSHSNRRFSRAAPTFPLVIWTCRPQTTISICCRTRP
jgi:hypothetical protein